MFPSSSSTSNSPAVRAKLNLSQGVANELLDKIVALQIDRQLSKEREVALLELLEFYRREMPQNQESGVAGPLEVPEIVCTSPSSEDSQQRRWPSPAQSTISESIIEEDITPYILEGSEAIKTLHGLSTSSAVLSLFKTEAQAELYQLAVANLEKIPKFISRFAGGAASLRGRCLRSQDKLVEGVIESFMTHAKAKQNQLDLEHPMELTLYFHGLPEVLTRLCKQAWCLGHQSDYCIHRLSPEMNELTAVTMVHPGREWKNLQLCLFAAIAGATLLQGDIFSLIRTADVRDRQINDGAAWEEVFQDTDLVDVFWDVPDDASSTGTNISSVKSDAIGSDQPFGETANFAYDHADNECAITDSEATASRTSSGLEVHEQAGDVPAEQELVREGQPFELEDLRQAEAAMNELELDPERRSYPYLRAGEGSNASRRASFISAREEMLLTPEPPRGPYPYLKRGEGLRRRSRISLSSVKN